MLRATRYRGRCFGSAKQGKGTGCVGCGGVVDDG